MYEHIRIFTFKQLVQSLQVSCLRLREKLLDCDSYALLSIKGKSQEWVMQLAMRYLPEERPPLKTITAYQINWSQTLHPICSELINHFILFDDVFYSGTQLFNMLQDLLWEAESFPPSSTKTLYVISGAASRKVANSFDQNSQEGDSGIREVISHLKTFKIEVHLISSYIFPTGKDFFKVENIKGALLENLNRLKGYKSLLLTEWKTPDIVSFPKLFTDGFDGLVESRYFDRAKTEWQEPEKAELPFEFETYYDELCPKRFQYLFNSRYPVNTLHKPY